MLNPVTFFKGVIDIIGDVISYINPDSEGFAFKDLFSWLNPLSDNFILKNLWNFLSDIISFIGSILSYLNPFSENFAFKDLFSWINPFSENFIFKDLFSWLNPFSENFILKKLWEFLTNIVGFIGDILSYINPFSENFFAYKLMELLSDALHYLFVPSEERISAIQNTVSSKFDFIDSIKIGINSFKNIINNIGNAPKLTLDLGATKYTQAGNFTVLDFSFYAPYKPYGDLVLTGFIYIIYLWRLFISAPSIINGVGGSVNTVNTLQDTLNKYGGGK